MVSDVAGMVQIVLLKNYSYSIRLFEKKKKKILKKQLCEYERTMNMLP